jgi:hypothetical protein
MTKTFFKKSIYKIGGLWYNLYTDGKAATAIGEIRMHSVQGNQRSVKLMTPTRKKLLAYGCAFLFYEITVYCIIIVNNFKKVWKSAAICAIINRNYNLCFRITGGNHLYGKSEKHYGSFFIHNQYRRVSGNKILLPCHRQKRQACRQGCREG